MKVSHVASHENCDPIQVSFRVRRRIPSSRGSATTLTPSPPLLRGRYSGGSGSFADTDRGKATMIRIAFVIGGYPPEEYKRRADVARSYSTAEIEVGIIDTKASPYFYGITPAEIQLVTPAYIESYRQAEKEGYDAVVPLGMLDLGVDGGRSAVDIPVVGPMESSLHIASLAGRPLRTHHLSRKATCI